MTPWTAARQASLSIPNSRSLLKLTSIGPGPFKVHMLKPEPPEQLYVGQTVHSGEKRECLLHCWRGCNWLQPLWRTQWRFFKKLKTELLCEPAIPLLGRYPEKKHNLKRHTHPSVHSSQDMEATQVSINRGMEKEDVVH